MKEVHLRVSGVYRSNWSKNIQDKWLNMIYRPFSYLLRFVEDKDGNLCLDSDSKPQYEKFLKSLSEDIKEAKHAQLHFPHWSQGEILIQDLGNDEIGGFDINNLQCLKQCKEYVKNKLLHAQLPDDSNANLKQSTSVHGDIALVSGCDASIGHAQTSACIMYGFKTNSGLVIEKQISINLRYICKNGRSWGLIDEKDPLGNYNDSIGEYDDTKSMLNRDMEELQKADSLATWYFGRVVVQSKYKWEHSHGSGVFNASFPIANLYDFLQLHRYVQEKLPWFEKPFDNLKKISHLALEKHPSLMQAAPIVHAFSRSDEMKKPLITKPQQEEQDSETPSCNRLLKQVFCC